MEKDLFTFKLNHLTQIPHKIFVRKVLDIYNKNHHYISIPGSKSFTNRALILAGMSTQTTLLKGFLFANDSYWVLLALISLGFHVECDFINQEVFLTPPNKFQEIITPIKIHMGSSGTMARFFPSVILNWIKTYPQSPSLCVQLTASNQLSTRPIQELLNALLILGAHIKINAFEKSFPLQIESSNLNGSCQISGKISSQFLSGLLIAASGSKNHIKIERTHNLVQPGYVHMTLNAIHAFGGDIYADNELKYFSIQSIKTLACPTFQIEADASTACYFIATAVLHNFNLELLNLGKTSLQPDLKFIEFLTKLGAKISVYENKINVHKRNLNLLKGGFSFNFSEMSDQAITAGVLALFTDAPIEITGIDHIRHHESDRIFCFVNNLNSLNAQALENKAGFTIFPIKKELIGDWKTWDDHRFVMSGFLLASMFENLAILNPECVQKTAPYFFNLIEKVGFKVV